ncbi:hypothetical protein RHSIM_Rhsim05G0073100 [Rhododendron simsii]|uniref:Uncharacterized protein n=1 Tax=Rhododendron simsii TaxID=118357 RepID=A0A834GWW9_RHOSS|nr:hypothetical protein RHSIM_Rhsim05G0073100 [Rhododendron simsii]
MTKKQKPNPESNHNGSTAPAASAFPSSCGTLGRHLARRLTQIGVRDVFSVLGDFNLTLLDHLIAEPELNLVGCCNELNAGYAANGYARANRVSPYMPNNTMLYVNLFESFHELKSLPNGLAHLKALKLLCIGSCDKLKSLPEEGLRGLESLQHLKMEIHGCPKLVALPEGIKHLKYLQCLLMYGESDFAGLVALPETLQHVPALSDFTGLVALPETLQHVPALQYLHIGGYPTLTSLPNWLGNLTTLQSLTIIHCPKLSSLPASIQRLTKLRILSITYCGPELARRCEKGKGEDWHKIAHIPHVNVDAPAKPKVQCFLFYSAYDSSVFMKLVNNSPPGRDMLGLALAPNSGPKMGPALMSFVYKY